MSKIDSPDIRKRKAQSSELESHMLLKPGAIIRSSFLPECYHVNEFVVNAEYKKNTKDQYFLWCFGRRIRTRHSLNVPDSSDRFKF